MQQVVTVTKWFSRLAHEWTVATGVCFDCTWSSYSCSTDLPDDITKADTQVVARHPVHPNPLIPTGVIRQDNAHSLPPFSSSQHHGVPAEELQLLCLVLMLTDQSKCKLTVMNLLSGQLMERRTCDRLTMLLSSLSASSTISRLGLCFCFRMAVEKSSPFGLPYTDMLTLSHQAAHALHTMI